MFLDIPLGTPGIYYHNINFWINIAAIIIFCISGVVLVIKKKDELEVVIGYSMFAWCFAGCRLFFIIAIYFPNELWNPNSYGFFVALGYTLASIGFSSLLFMVEKYFITQTHRLFTIAAVILTCVQGFTVFVIYLSGFISVFPHPWSETVTFLSENVGQQFALFLSSALSPAFIGVVGVMYLYLAIKRTGTLRRTALSVIVAIFFMGFGAIFDGEKMVILAASWFPDKVALDFYYCIPPILMIAGILIFINATLSAAKSTTSNTTPWKVFAKYIVPSVILFAGLLILIALILEIPGLSIPVGFEFPFIFTLIILLFKFILSVFLGTKIVKTRNDENVGALWFIVGCWIMITCLLISRFFYMIFDFFLTKFNMATYPDYPNIWFWKSATLIAAFGLGALLLIIDKKLLQNKFKGLFAIIIFATGLIQFFYPVANLADFTVVSTIGTIADICGFLIPVFFFWIAKIQAHNRVLRNIALSIAIGSIIYMIGSTFVSATVINLFGLEQSIMYGISTVMKSAGLIMLSYGAIHFII